MQDLVPDSGVVIQNMPSSAPRPFRFAVIDAVTRHQLLFGGLWAVFGLLLSVILTVVGGPFWNDLVLDLRGVEAQAIPTSIELASFSINDRRVYRIAYTFTDKTGVRRTSSGETTAPETIARAKRNQSLTIDYHPNAPTLSRLKGENASSFGLLVLMPFGFGVVGSSIFAIGLRRSLRVRKMYIHGQLVRARVTAVSPSKMWLDRTEVMRIDYAFDAITGAVSGRTTSVTPPQVGATIWVLYDPYEPKRSIVASYGAH